MLVATRECRCLWLKDQALALCFFRAFEQLDTMFGITFRKKQKRNAGCERLSMATILLPSGFTVGMCGICLHSAHVISRMTRT